MFENPGSCLLRVVKFPKFAPVKLPIQPLPVIGVRENPGADEAGFLYLGFELAVGLLTLPRSDAVLVNEPKVRNYASEDPDP